MRDVIEFPTNADQYYRKALNVLKTRNFDQALELLHKSYEAQPQLHVFEEIIKIYIHRGQKEALARCWETYFPDIHLVKEPEILLLYGASLPLLFPLDQALLRLYQLQGRYQALGWSGDALSPLIHQLNHTQQLSQQLDQALASGQQALLEFIDSLNRQHGFHLLSFLKHSYDTPLETCLPFYQAVLSHPELAQYIKSDVLHYLVFQHFPGSVDYNWFGHRQLLEVSQLEDYRHQSSFPAGMGLIEAYCEQHNPHLLVEFCQQFVLHCLAVYPFFDRAFGSAEEWFQLFLTENDLTNPYQLEISANHRQTYERVADELRLLIYQEEGNPTP